MSRSTEPRPTTAPDTGAEPAAGGDVGVVDVSHATPELVALLAEYFSANNRRDVDGTMARFSRSPTSYIDATLGWIFPSWDDLRAVFSQVMPNRPKTARSYPTRILGDTGSAMVLFTSTPEVSGGEIRSIASVNFENGGSGIDRWVDYWDGRHFGIAAVNSRRTPADEFPQDFRESTVREHTSPGTKHLVTALSKAFANADADGAVVLFAEDASFEDLTLRSALVGRAAIVAFLRRALPHLPYGGSGVTVVHTVGSAQGGGYEWAAPGAAVPRGAVALELDAHGRISRLTTVWDGSLVTTDGLLAMLALTIGE
jgi:hypothetical protein